MSDTPLSATELAEIAKRTEDATPGAWEEEWRQVPGFDGYEVSDFGSVRSYYKKGRFLEKLADHPRTLKPATSTTGYKTVALPVNGRYKHCAVHRLVLRAFVGECPEGNEVAHLNGVRTDNRLSNLQYVTHIENEAHKIAHGTAPLGELNGQAILQGWQVAEIKYLASKSVPQGKIATLFDISHKDVSEILRGGRWGHVEARTDIPRLVADLRAARETLARLAQPDEAVLSAMYYAMMDDDVDPFEDVDDNSFYAGLVAAVKAAAAMAGAEHASADAASGEG
jgi:hypothetical protein